MNIKNSPATGPDSISNFHLKHLGPQRIQALTNNSNYTYTDCLILKIWKQGRIITILKLNKDPITPSSYRPITLLCKPSKITECLILNIIHPDVPLAPTKHGFQPLHSINTLLTNLKHVLDGINSKIPAQKTLLKTIDISKAFDAIPRHRLANKLYNTNMHNNTKRWLVANYLGGRQSHVSFNGKSSHTRNFPKGVPKALFCLPHPQHKHNVICRWLHNHIHTQRYPHHQSTTTRLPKHITDLVWHKPTKSGRNWVHNPPLHQLHKITSTHTTTNTDNTAIIYKNYTKLLGVT